MPEFVEVLKYKCPITELESMCDNIIIRTTKKMSKTFTSGLNQEPQASSPSSGSDDEFLFTCVESKLPKMPSVNVKVSNVKVKMIIDTGASINIIDEKTYAHISKSTPISLKRTRTWFHHGYGSTEQLPVIGQFEAILETKKRITVSTIHVVKGNCGSLLSYQTCNRTKSYTSKH